MASRLFAVVLWACFLLSLEWATLAFSEHKGARAEGRSTPRARMVEPVGNALFESPQFHPIVASADGSRVYVANTTSHTVSVLDVRQRRRSREVDEIPVGMEPVSLALRPDEKQLWVSNHLSDSISVIDAEPGSPTFHQVVATIQDLGRFGLTHFNEPVGIAFASSSKAYVALSASNEIAVIDIAGDDYQVRPGRIPIGAQDPRALTVRNGLLFVAAFESGNQTEISVCVHGDGTEQCTAGVADTLLSEDGQRVFASAFPNNIVRDPSAPDRDLFVFETEDESPVDAVSHLGTLLYGLSVSSRGRVFVSHTEARNDVNGLVGGALADLENRPFLNRISAVDCGAEGCAADAMQIWELEAPVGHPIVEGRQLATPYGISVSDDDRILVVTAAASGRVFTVDANSGEVLGMVHVGAGPRGVALFSKTAKRPAKLAYVLNTLDNTVSVVDVSKPTKLRVLQTIAVGSDPTPERLRLGRIAFNNAKASSSGTFACASCHPDGHIDQLLWRIGAARAPEVSLVHGSDEIRTTQPVKGLRNTLPLHWDGTLGDPFGGPNGFAGLGVDGGSDCDLETQSDHACFLDLVMASLGGPMCDQSGDCPRGGKRLTHDERNAIATYLSSVWHGPPPLRAMHDRVTPSARRGFADFYVDQGGLDAGTCANAGCHELPLAAGTNGSNLRNGAFDAPSLRGITDRFVLLSNGATAPHEVLAFSNNPVGLPRPFDRAAIPSEFPYDPLVGKTESTVFASHFWVFRLLLNVGPVDIFRMFQEASTGTSGATGRQVTLSTSTLEGTREARTVLLLQALERADARGVVALVGTVKDPDRYFRLGLEYHAEKGLYRIAEEWIDRTELIERARAAKWLVTLTANLPIGFGLGIHRQPLLSTASSGVGPTGNPPLPVLQDESPVPATGIDIRKGAKVFLDGQPIDGEVACIEGNFEPEFCSSQRVAIQFAEFPTQPGLKLLQVQNPDGPLSNEFPICVAPVAACR